MTKIIAIATAPESGDPAVPAPAPVEQPAPVETPGTQDPADPPAPPADEPAPAPATPEPAPAAPAPAAPVAPAGLKERVLRASRDKSALAGDLKTAQARLAQVEAAHQKLAAEHAGMVEANAKLGADLTTTQAALAALQAESKDVEAMVSKQVAAELAALGHPAEDLPGVASADKPDGSDVLATFNSLKGAPRTEFFIKHEAAIVAAQRALR